MRPPPAILLALALFASPALAQPAQPPAPDAPLRFATLLASEFPKWDTNHNGQLDPAEIDAAVLDPEVKGEDAAIAAAAHNFLFQESREGRTVAITRQWLAESQVANTSRAAYFIPAPPPPPANPSPGVATTQPSSPSEPTGLPPGVKPALSPQGMFDRARRAILRGDRRLFGGDNIPAFTDLHQGPLGDCYLISVLGGRTWFDPTQISSMLAERPDGTYLIRWGDGTSTQVPPLTDGELGVGGASITKGLWVRVLENGLARRKLPDDAPPAAATPTLASSSIGLGGQTRPIIMLLTGHHAESIRLFAGRPTPPTQPEIQARSELVRQILLTALPAKRLLAAGTPPSPKPPPGMNPRHAYAVLNFADSPNPAQATLTLWNPHANDYTPKLTPGPNPGLTHGYLTRKGIFTIPLADFVQAFNTLAWETATPIRPGELNLSPTLPNSPAPSTRTPPIPPSPSPPLPPAPPH